MVLQRSFHARLDNWRRTAYGICGELASAFVHMISVNAQ
jgi:hypothetical protein